MKLSFWALFASACILVTAVGCEGTTNSTATPNDADGVNVDVDSGQPDSEGRVDVRVDLDGVEGDPADTPAERREQRRERIGDALENLDVDVNSEGVKVDAGGVNVDVK